MEKLQTLEALETLDLMVLDDDALAGIDGGCRVCDYIRSIIFPHHPIEPEIGGGCQQAL